MVIDTSGNVGITTTSPRSKFEVVSGAVNTNADVPGTAAAFVGSQSSGQGSTVSIESNAAQAADTGGILGFGGRYNTGTGYANWASIKGLKTDSTDSNYGGYLSFWTRNNAASNAEIMRLTGTGNVGIGTTGPNGKLHVAGAGANIYVEATSGMPEVAMFAPSGQNTSQLHRIGGTLTGQQVVNATSYTINSYASTGFAVTTNSIQRLRVTFAGGISFGNSDTAYGTSGQVLQSNGNAPPTWVAQSSVTAGNFNNGSLYISPTNLNTLNSGYSQASDSADIWLNYRGYADAFAYFRDFRVGNGKGTQIALFTGSTGNLLVAGSVTGSAGVNGTTVAAQGWGVRVVGGTGDTQGILQFTNYAQNAQWSSIYVTSGTLGISSAVTATGDITAFSSDRRLKTDVRPITNAVDKVKSLNGIIYKWNDLANTLAGYNTTEDLVGLFAQEVDAVLPYAVKPAPFDIENGTSKSGENYLTVQYEKLTPLLVEAIKEQQATIEDQNTRIKRLEDMVEQLLNK